MHAQCGGSCVTQREPKEAQCERQEENREVHGQLDKTPTHPTLDLQWGPGQMTLPLPTTSLQGPTLSGLAVWIPVPQIPPFPRNFLAGH